MTKIGSAGGIGHCIGKFGSCGAASPGLVGMGGTTGLIGWGGTGFPASGSGSLVGMGGA